MRLFMRLWVVLGVALAAVPAMGRTPDEIIRDAMSASGLEIGIDAFTQIKSLETSGKAGLGMLRFARGIERFAQAMYRHGLRPGGRSAAPLLLGMDLPTGNPNPEPLSYEQFRKILADLSADMKEADAALKEVGEADFKLKVDLASLRIDIDGDGVRSPEETLFGLVRRGAMTDMPEGQPFIVGFDSADLHWLRGYSNLIGAVTDFWLAYDFRVTFESTFQAFFPSNTPTDQSKVLAGGQGSLMNMDGRDIADFIAMVHLIQWPVAEPERLKSARLRLLDVVALNRVTWRLARAETDDELEWLPNPKQKSVALPMFSVTDERLDAWLAAVGEIELLLEGKALMPHWRFSPPDLNLAFVEPKPGEKPKPLTGQGINLKRFFEEPAPFDLILWVTGHAAVPYLEQGEVARFDAWSQAERVFEGNLFTYAFWFN